MHGSALAATWQAALPRETPQISTSFDMVHNKVSNHGAATKFIAGYLDPR